MKGIYIMKKRNVKKFSLLFFCILAAPLISPQLVVAGIIAETYFELGDYPNDSPIPGWTANGLGGGRATTVLYGNRWYSSDDFDVSHEENFLFEGVFSAVSPGFPGIESGARLQVAFDDPNVPNPFEPNNSLRTIEVRLIQNSDGTNLRASLFDGNMNVNKQSISLDWRLNYAIRLMRQNIGGIDKIIMEAERGSEGIVRVEEDFTNFSAVQPIAGFASEFRFGNLLGLSTDSFWESIHVRTWNDNQVSPVPEPATMLLFGTGLAGLAAIGRRRK